MAAGTPTHYNFPMPFPVGPGDREVTLTMIGTYTGRADVANLPPNRIARVDCSIFKRQFNAPYDLHMLVLTSTTRAHLAVVEYTDEFMVVRNNGPEIASFRLTVRMSHSTIM